MADPKGDKLYVNLSAARTKQRLKGFGHGVRKVHSAGRNRAVVIHTATGEHLAELERKFADVGFSTTEPPLLERPLDDAPEQPEPDAGPSGRQEAPQTRDSAG